MLIRLIDEQTFCVIVLLAHRHFACFTKHNNKEATAKKTILITRPSIVLGSCFDFEMIETLVIA